jgi:prevent-host-death family protein
MANQTSAVKADEAETESSETVITASEVQDRLGDVMDRAFSGERFRVTRHGRDRIYIIGAAAYERLRKLEQGDAATAAA